MDSGRGITGGGSGYAALLAHAGEKREGSVLKEGEGQGPRPFRVVVVFITVTCTANGGHWVVPPGGLQAYSLPQPWLCRAPKVRRGGEGDACVSMETCNIKIHNREHRISRSHIRSSMKLS